MAQMAPFTMANSEMGKSMVKVAKSYQTVQSMRVIFIRIWNMAMALKFSQINNNTMGNGLMVKRQEFASSIDTLMAKHIKDLYWMEWSMGTVK